MKHLPIALLAFGLTAGGVGTVAGTPAPAPTPHSAPHSAPHPAKAHTAAANPCAADNLSPTSRTVAPVAVFTTSGTVGNASALLNGQNTRLTGNGSAVTLDFGKDVGGVGKRNLVAIGICAIDVVETNGNLGHNLQPAFARFKQFGIHLVAQSGNQAIDTRLYFFKNQFLWGRFRLRIDFDLVTTFPQQIERFPEVGGGKNTEFLAHDCLWVGSQQVLSCPFVTKQR